MFSFFSSILLNAGFVLKISSFAIDYSMFISIFMVFIVLKVFFKKGFQNIINLKVLALITSIFISLIPVLFFKNSIVSVPFGEPWEVYFGQYGKQMPIIDSISLTQFLGMFIRLLIFISIIMAFKTLQLNNKFLCTLVLKSPYVSFFVIILSAIEFFISNSVSPSLFRNIIINFLGGFDSSTYILPRQLNNIYMPLLTFREPSNFSICLIVLILCQFYVYKLKNKKITLITIFMLIVLMLTINSMSSLLYLICLLLVVFFSVQQVQIKFFILLSGLILLIISSLLFNERLTELFKYFPLLFSDSSIGLPMKSELVRLYSIANNLKLFLNYPLFGCGFSLAYSFSGLVTTLSNIGLIGLFFWSLILIDSIAYFRINTFSKIKGLLLLFLFYSFSGHMNQMIYMDFSFVLFLLFSNCNPSSLLHLSKEFYYFNNYNGKKRNMEGLYVK